MDASQRLIFSWDDADQADEELRKKEEAELFKMHKQMQLRKLQADGLAKQVEAAEEERRLQLRHNNSCLGCIVCAPSCTKYACLHHTAPFCGRSDTKKTRGTTSQNEPVEKAQSKRRCFVNLASKKCDAGKAMIL